jgi:hypothetical protein
MGRAYGPFVPSIRHLFITINAAGDNVRSGTGNHKYAEMSHRDNEKYAANRVSVPQEPSGRAVRPASASSDSARAYPASVQ